MSVLHRIRIYHAILAGLSMLAYVTGEWGVIHAWLGYGVALVILFRLLWALSGERQLGLERFYPSFEGLAANNLFTHPAISRTFLMGIAVSLIAVTLSGIAIDRGRAVGLADAQIIGVAHADNDDHDGQEDGGFLGEIHEFFANVLLFFVGMHVTYLLLFKYSLARFMLFLSNPKPKQNDTTTPTSPM